MEGAYVRAGNRAAMTYFEEAKQIMARMLCDLPQSYWGDFCPSVEMMPKSHKGNKPAIAAWYRARLYWQRRIEQKVAGGLLAKFQFREIPDRKPKGQSKVRQAKQDTYRRFWESCEKTHGGLRDAEGNLWLLCSECTASGIKYHIPYAAAHCSHIISKGAHPAIAHDLDNLEVLCLDHHRQWEDSHARKSMRIYPELQKRRRELLQRHLIDKT